MFVLNLVTERSNDTSFLFSRKRSVCQRDWGTSCLSPGCLSPGCSVHDPTDRRHRTHRRVTKDLKSSDVECAYKASLHGQAAPAQDGFNGDQQFYIAFAQSWASKLPDSALRNEVLTDTHSPNHWRALTVRNEDPWYAAFDVKPGDKLSPADRVQIW
jgi:Peptidase family M13